jgi:hypothetical protein
MKKSRLVLALGAWFAVALVLTLVAPPTAVSTPTRSAIILGPVIVLTLFYFGVRSLRDTLAELPLRVFVGVHRDRRRAPTRSRSLNPLRRNRQMWA